MKTRYRPVCIGAALVCVAFTSVQAQDTSSAKADSWEPAGTVPTPPATISPAPDSPAPAAAVPKVAVPKVAAVDSGSTAAAPAAGPAKPVVEAQPVGAPPAGNAPPVPAAAKPAEAPMSSAVTAEGPPKAVSIPAGIVFGTFTKEDGPFLIEGSVIVPSGQVLEFGPGCVVYVGGEYSTITVFGQLVARGTAAAPVVFMSANPKPNPWDWDRIYCRSRNRSVFEHCIVRHSNYGIYVENGSASIQNCLFERNSLHGVVARNAEVSLDATTFRGGHVMALLLQAGAQIQSDSLVMRDNITGVGCDDNSQLKLTGGSISRNVNGMAVSPGASISIVATEISNNKNGLLSLREIPKKTREMVYGNSIDVKQVDAAEMQKLLKQPEAVRTVVLPKTATKAEVADGFSAGFSALSAPQDPIASFIGNVTVGAGYYMPETVPNPAHDTIVPQSRYPEGVQPDIQVFASGRRGTADVNFLMDLYGNEWLSTSGYVGKNLFNLSMTYARQALVFGDFFESGSETSISGRQMTGLRFSGNSWDMGGGAKRFEYKLAAGETEIPKDSGDHELNLYNEVVDSGMSVRQQLTYVATFSVKPTRNSTFSAKGIIARDQVDKPLFRNPITDPAAPDPIQAQTGCLDFKTDLLGGALEAYAELDLGTHDTLDSAEAEEVAWYNPKIEEAVPRVFRLLRPGDFMDYYAATVGSKGTYQGYDLELAFTQIAPYYFSAGNPYLEADRRKLAFTGSKQVFENLSASSQVSYERTAVHQTPTDRGDLGLRGEYGLGENRPALSLDYTFRAQKTNTTERVTDTVVIAGTDSARTYTYDEPYDDIEVNNLVGVEGKQTLANGLSYSLRYQLLWDNDISEHANLSYADEGDGMQHQVSGWLTFKLQKLLRNKSTFRVATKNENQDSLRALQYKVGDQLSVYVIPRKLTVNVSGEYSWKREKEYNDNTSVGDIGWLAPVVTKVYGVDGEIKYMVTPKVSLSVDANYERSRDDTDGSPENFDLKSGGAHVTFLF